MREREKEIEEGRRSIFFLYRSKCVRERGNAPNRMEAADVELGVDTIRQRSAARGCSSFPSRPYTTFHPTCSFETPIYDKLLRNMNIVRIYWP